MTENITNAETDKIDEIIKIVAKALTDHPRAWIDNCKFDKETETYEIDVSGIEEGCECDAIEAAETALDANGWHLIASDEDGIGRFWILVD